LIMTKGLKILVFVLLCATMSLLGLLISTPDIDEKFLYERTSFIDLFNQQGFETIRKSSQKAISETRSTAYIVTKTKGQLSDLMILVDELERGLKLLKTEISDKEKSNRHIDKINKLIERMNKVSAVENMGVAFHYFQLNSDAPELRRLEASIIESQTVWLVMEFQDRLLMILS
jgi:hypothetical protein